MAADSTRFTDALSSAITRNRLLDTITITRDLPFLRSIQRQRSIPPVPPPVESVAESPPRTVVASEEPIKPGQMYGRVAISDRMIYGLKSREAEFMILEELRRAGIDHVTRRYPLAHDCVTIFEGPLTDEAVMRHVMKGRAEGISKAIKDGKVTKTGRFIDLTRKR